MQHSLTAIVRTAVLPSLIISLSIATIVRNAAVWNNTIDAWTDAVEKSPLKARTHYNLGKSLYLAGSLTAAEASLLRAAELADEPTKTADVFCCLAMVYEARGYREAAMSVYFRVLEMNESNIIALNNLGLMLLRTEKYAEAERLFRQAILVDPKCSRAYVNLGKSLDAQGRSAEAAYYISAARSLGFFEAPQAPVLVR